MLSNTSQDEAWVDTSEPPFESSRVMWILLTIPLTKALCHYHGQQERSWLSFNQLSDSSEFGFLNLIIQLLPNRDKLQLTETEDKNTNTSHSDGPVMHTVVTPISRTALRSRTTQYRTRKGSKLVRDVSKDPGTTAETLVTVGNCSLTHDSH